MPGSQKNFKGRHNISVGQPIVVPQPKQKYNLEVDLFKKGWSKISLDRPLASVNRAYVFSMMNAYFIFKN